MGHTYGPFGNLLSGPLPVCNFDPLANKRHEGPVKADGKHGQCALIFIKEVFGLLLKPLDHSSSLNSQHNSFTASGDAADETRAIIPALRGKSLLLFSQSTILGYRLI